MSKSDHAVPELSSLNFQSLHLRTVGRYRHLLFVSGLVNKRRNGLAIHSSFGETGSSFSFYSSNMLSILEHPSYIYDHRTLQPSYPVHLGLILRLDMLVSIFPAFCFQTSVPSQLTPDLGNYSANNVNGFASAFLSFISTRKAQESLVPHPL
jgi:hypothetical protein